MNLSISLTVGKESNSYNLSNGERRGFKRTVDRLSNLGKLAPKEIPFLFWFYIATKKQKPKEIVRCYYQKRALHKKEANKHQKELAKS